MMSAFEGSETYSQRFARTGPIGLEPFCFLREVLERFVRDPRYVVSDHALSSSSDDTGGLQQYVNALGPNGEPAIMVLLAHLDHLTVEEQRHFKLYELPGGRVSDDMLRPILYGEFPETFNPTYAMAEALTSINGLVHPQTLFRMADMQGIEETEEFLAIRVNSKKGYLDFANALDKLLGDNLRHKFFDGQGVAKSTEDGQQTGTIGRLALWLEDLGVDDTVISEVCDPLRRVRRERQPRAHKLERDDASADYLQLQEALYSSAVEAVRALCRALGKKRGGPEWEEPYHLAVPLRPYRQE